MAAPRQLVAHLLRHPRLDLQRLLDLVRVVGVLAGRARRPARQLGRLLGVEAEVDHRRQHLQVHLHLDVGAGRPEDAPEGAVAKHDRRVHRVPHPPPRPQLIGVARLQVPVGHAVVHEDAGVAGDNARSEGAVDALDAGDGVALAVDDREVCGLAACRQCWRRRRRSLEVDPGRLGSRVVGREQLLERRLERPRVGAPALAVGEGELLRLDQHVQRVGAQQAHPGQVEVLGDGQLLEQHEADRVGRRLEHREAAVVDRDRLLQLRLERLQVGRRDERPGIGQRRRQAPPQRPPIERLGALGRHLLERPRQLLIDDEGAERRHVAARLLDRRPVGVGGGKAALGECDRLPGAVGPGQPPRPPVQHPQAGQHPRHRDRERPGQRDAVAIALEGRRGRRRAGRVDHLAAPAGAVEDVVEAVAAEAGHGRLDHGQRERRRHRRVGGAPAGPQRLQARLGGQRMVGGDRAAAAHDQRPVGGPVGGPGERTSHPRNDTRWRCNNGV